LQDNISDTAALIRYKEVKWGLKACQVAPGTPTTSANFKSIKAALNACLTHELHLVMETFMTAIQEQAVTH